MPISNYNYLVKFIGECCWGLSFLHEDRRVFRVGREVVIISNIFQMPLILARKKTSTQFIHNINLTVILYCYLCSKIRHCLMGWTQDALGEVPHTLLRAFSVSRRFGDPMSLEDGVHGAAADSQALGRQFLVPAAFFQNIQQQIKLLVSHSGGQA